MYDSDTSELRLYGNLLWRRRFDLLLTIPLVLLAMGFYTLRQPKVYESSMLLLVGQKPPKPQIVTPESTPDLKPDSDVLDTEVQLLQTLPLISQATTQLQPVYPNLDPQTVAENLKVQQLGKAGVINVAYQDADPQRLVAVLSQLGKTYVDFSLTNRRSQVTSAIQFIERKLPEEQAALAKSSQQLTDFRERNRLVDPKDLGDTALKTITDLDAQERAAIAAVQQEQERYNTLQERMEAAPQEALAAASLSQDPIYLELLKQYQEAENAYRAEQIRFTDTSPQVMALQAKRDALNQQLQQRATRIQGVTSSDTPQLNDLQVDQVAELLESQNNLKVQQARLATIQAARPSLEENLRVVPGLKQQYEGLVSRVRQASDNVTRLTNKLEEFRILEAQESPNWQVIQPPAAPTKTVSPNLRLNFMIGSVLALMLGGLVALIHDQLDRRLRTVGAVNESLKLRTLSVIPQVNRRLLRDPAAASGFGLRTQGFHLQSAIQHLLFTLRSLGQGRSLQAIGFTSSTSQEGKSTIVRQLGLCAAEMGRQVLLIDGDLRKPDLHLSLQCHNEPGLSNLVTDHLTWSEVIQPTTYPGLSFLAAGTAVANPVALLDSDKMRQVLTQLRDHYDLILMDLPPVIGLTDALAASQHLDGLVFVVALNRIKTDQLKLSVEALSSADRPPIGVVCNLSELADAKHLAPYMNQRSYPQLPSMTQGQR